MTGALVKFTAWIQWVKPSLSVADLPTTHRQYFTESLNMSSHWGRIWTHDTSQLQAYSSVSQTFYNPGPLQTFNLQLRTPFFFMFVNGFTLKMKIPFVPPRTHTSLCVPLVWESLAYSFPADLLMAIVIRLGSGEAKHAIAYHHHCALKTTKRSGQRKVKPHNDGLGHY